MTIHAEIIKDSVSTAGVRLTTFVLIYPRFIHSELMTHRAFSRNASSSRAIPFERQIQMLKEDIARPLEFRENKAGMQAGKALSERQQNVCNYVWSEACRSAIRHAEDLHLAGAHKQYVNRIIEPFSHICVVLSGTELANFFALRIHKDAQPEIAELAAQMYDAREESIPYLRRTGEWHLPFVPEKEYQAVKHDEEAVQALVRKSVACCARTSYKNHDKTDPTPEQNETLYKRLVGAQPIHASPTEHQAVAMQYHDVFWGNFRGWKQHRQFIPNENIVDWEPYAGPTQQAPDGV